jgi:hypothetical protein
MPKPKAGLPAAASKPLLLAVLFALLFMPALFANMARRHIGVMIARIEFYQESRFFCFLQSPFEPPCSRFVCFQQIVSMLAH